MEANENITLSLKDHLVVKLQAMGYQQVYYIQDMRDVVSGVLKLSTLDRRYIFLTSNFLKPTVTTLPFVVLEVQDIDRTPWQLGDDGEGRIFNVFVHVFGRSQSERNQVASYLQGTSGIGRSVTYNDYSGSAPVENTFPIQRTSGIMLSNAPPVRNEQIVEQSLANWNILSFEARTIA